MDKNYRNDLKYKPCNLSIQSQLELFRKRGMIIPQKGSQSYNIDLNKLQNIGYYKLKEFSYPFIHKIHSNKPKYYNLSFSHLLNRYYLDKQLRIYLLSAMENLEVSLNSNISDILGDNKDPYKAAFGYLNLHSWTNHEFSKNKILHEQYYLKNYIKKVLSKHILFKDIKNNQNRNKDGYPSIWLVANIITFGITTYLICYMSKNNQIKLANRYSCSTDELVSWVKCLRFIRNLCAHNDNLIDFKLAKRPIKPKMFQQFIMHYSQGYSRAIATPIFVLKYLMLSVNPNYKFKHVRKILKKLIINDKHSNKSKDERAQNYGFNNFTSIKYLSLTRNQLNESSTIKRIINNIKIKLL